ncbi:MAG: lipopolysaccharide transport periplasmic protein LptA [Desulfobulbus sp.]|nr:lipopolysaccharide transport periplasmic protein LptA [Desulfobulbus sp.]
MKYGPGIRLRMLYLLIFMTLALLSPAFAAEADQPISIEANRMVSQEKESSVIFQGKVDARQGNLTIRADEMTVYYSTKNPQNVSTNTDKPTNKVEKLICKKNVKVSQGDWLGTGDRMDYFAPERKVVLSGNAKAWQGQNMVAGKTITYYLDQKRSVVEQDENAKSRVRAVIHPESKKKP